MRYFTDEGLRAEVHSSTTYLIAYTEACALERVGVAADNVLPDELRRIIEKASTDRRNKLFAHCENPHRANEPLPIKREAIKREQHDSGEETQRDKALFVSINGPTQRASGGAASAMGTTRWWKDSRLT